MRTPRTLLTAALLALAALAPAAGAARAGVVATLPVPLGADRYGQGFANGNPGLLVSGPVLAGGGIAWAQEGAGQAVDVHVLGPRDRAPRTVATLPAVAPTDQLVHAFSLLGSPTRLAWAEDQQRSEQVGRQYWDHRPFQDRVQAGAVDGPFTTVLGCDALGAGTTCAQAPCVDIGGALSLPDAELSGDTLTTFDRCRPDGTRPDDPLPMTAYGTVRTTRLDATPPVTTAGAFLESTPGNALFLDALTPSLALFRPHFSSPPQLRRVADGGDAGWPYPAVDTRAATVLQDDGRLATFVHRQEAPGGTAVAWAAPGDTALHVLPGTVAAGSGTLGFAGDHIIYVAGGGADGRRVVVSDLAGATRTLVRLPPTTSATRAAAVLAAVDFDGTTATWAVTRCERTYIGVSSAVDAAVAFPPAECDTPRIVGSAATADRRGRVAIPVMCAKPCRGTVAFHVAPYATTVYARFSLPGSRHIQKVGLVLTGVLRRAQTRHVVRGDVRVVQQPKVPEQPFEVR